MLSNVFQNRAVYEKMSKNLVVPARPQITMWRRVASWIIKATRAQTDARARLPNTRPPTPPPPPHTHTHT